MRGSRKEGVIDSVYVCVWGGGSFKFFYIMHEQEGMSRRTKHDQINRRSEALMMWHK